VVVFLLLLSSGLGSIAARPNTRLGLTMIVALILANVAFLPMLLSAAVGLAFVLKLLISVVVLAPLGFMMGMPFPTGLKLLSESGNCTVEWAWAMNAGASVLGSVTAMVIAIHFGLTITLICAAMAYVIAAISSGKLANSQITIGRAALVQRECELHETSL
jgi:hypothetical protein